TTGMRRAAKVDQDRVGVWFTAMTEQTGSIVPQPSLDEPIAPVVALRGIGKEFGATRAVDGIDLDIWPGEVHAVVGENGAGKSTLMRVLAGFFGDYEGSITVEGQTVAIGSPAQARSLGIALVHQELSLVPELTVAENIFLGREP